MKEKYSLHDYLLFFSIPIVCVEALVFPIALLDLSEQKIFLEQFAVYGFFSGFFWSYL